jgi:glutaminyl-tRNA synthetase
MEDPPGKFHRLKPGGEVRLRYAYIIRCDKIVKDADGNVTELRCSFDPETRSGSEGGERKVKGTIHWVAAAHCARAEVRLYDRLFKVPYPGRGENFESELNPHSLDVVDRAALEPVLGQAESGETFQFERLGYFSADPRASRPGQPVFNRVVTLRDSWAKLEQQARESDPPA